MRYGPSLHRGLNQPRFIPYHLRPLQEYLNRYWPTLTLRLNPREGHWIITDLRFHPNGLPARYSWDGVVGSNAGALGGKKTREVTVTQFVQRQLLVRGDETPDFWAYAPCRDRLIEVLHEAFHGNVEWKKRQEEEKRLANEEAEEDRNLKEMREAGRATAETAWHRGRGRVMDAGGHVTDQRKIDRAITKKMMDEDLGYDPAEVEAAVKETLAKGHEIALRK